MTHTSDDLSALRALAEEGRHPPLAGGPLLVALGLTLLLVTAGAWALTGLDALDPKMMIAANVGFAMVASLIGAAAMRALAARPPQRTTLTRIEALSWGFAGLAVGIHAGVLVLRALSGLEAPPNVIGKIATIGFLQAGVAYFVVAAMSRRTWLRIPGYGSMGAAVVMGVFADQALALPLTGVLGALLFVPPGIALIRAERGA
jgi:hypothetical protein